MKPSVPPPASSPARPRPASHSQSPPAATEYDQRAGLAHTANAPSPAQLTALAATLRDAQRALAARPVDAILASLAALFDRWLDRASPWRRRAEAALPAATGFSPEMVRFGLPLILEPLRAPAIGALLDTELGDRRALDGLAGGRRARGPALVLHVLPGNIPGLAAVPMALSLAVKAAALVKAGRGDRVFPALLARSLAEVDPALGACVAACYWRGGARACEDAALGAADLVVASGDDATIAALRTRTPGRFIGHGHRVSFGVVTREVLADPADQLAAAEALALDVAVWDQRGCLSPQLCFVEGNFGAACGFAEIVAEALGDLARRLPAATISVGERMAVHRFRDAAEWAGHGGAPHRLFALAGEGDGSVAVEPEAVFRPTPLCRSLRVMPLSDLAELEHILAPARAALEAAGLAAPGPRWARGAAQLRAWGVHRVCLLGAMQKPPLGWQQGGRPRVGDWVTWSPDGD